MHKLPEWIQDLKKRDDEARVADEEAPSGRLAYEALEVAWEALEYAIWEKENRVTEKARDAMRRIEDLGQ